MDGAPYFGLFRGPKAAVPFLMATAMMPVVTVREEMLRVRFGPWFHLDAPVGAVESVEGGVPWRGPVLGFTHSDKGPPYELQLRTTPGSLTAIRFTKPQYGEWLIRVRWSGTYVFTGENVDVLALSIADPEGLARALGFA